MGVLSSLVKALVPRATTGSLQPVSSRGGWWPVIRDHFPGAWQRDLEWTVESILTFGAVYRCINLIASDIAKMGLDLIEVGDDEIARPIENAAHSPVLRRPNHFQNRIQFFASWMNSKLIHGNTYILKARDGRNVVTGLYILDPELVDVLVAPNGEVFYRLRADNLSNVGEAGVTVPASEVIHDRMNATYYHPLVGISPLQAAGMSALQGQKIQTTSAKFFAAGGQPGGVLSTPEEVPDTVAARIKEWWQEEFGGNNIGKIAVLGNGLKFERMTLTAEDSQLIDQLKWSGEAIAAVFGIPAYKLGIGAFPTYDNIEALNAQYYSQCLQIHIEQIELALDEGLELPKRLHTRFDLDDLLRMDRANAVKTAGEAIKSGIYAINEARARFDLPPVEGGEVPYLQQQNWPINELVGREPPTASPAERLPPLAEPAQLPAPEEEEVEERTVVLDREASRRDLTQRIHRKAERCLRQAPRREQDQPEAT